MDIKNGSIYIHKQYKTIKINDRTKEYIENIIYIKINKNTYFITTDLQLQNDLSFNKIFLYYLRYLEEKDINYFIKYYKENLLTEEVINYILKECRGFLSYYFEENLKIQEEDLEYVGQITEENREYLCNISKNIW
mgnify:CR=1 FL=1